jgi:peptide deformylase
MILPITVYGNPILRKRSQELTPDYDGLNTTIDNMFETMYKAEGVGLAAPQVNKSIRLIVIDATPFEEDEPELKDFKKAFINPEILSFEGDEEAFNEGCLSLPGIREDVLRPTKIKVKYLDTDFKEHVEEWEGIRARVMQHEFDHLEGKLFVDRISPIRRRLLSGKLNAISKGKILPDYRIIPNK